MDDRKSKWLADQRERERREARASSASDGGQEHAHASTVSHPSEKRMPGPGHVLTSETPEETEDASTSPAPEPPQLRTRSINDNLEEDDDT